MKAKKCICLATGKIYNSTRDAERQTGLKNISEICSHRRLSAGGMGWEYISPEPVQETHAYSHENVLKTEEVWRDIKDYEGLYQISNLGHVRRLNARSISNSNNKNKNKILKSCITKSGYVQVSLYKNNIKKTHRVHKLVAGAFCTTF